MKAAQRKRLARRLFVLVGLAAVVGVVALGWTWYRSIPLERVEIVGERYAPADTLARLAGVADDTTLYGIDPVLVADRVRRHPWVRTAEATRLPTGTLRVRVEERVPVALAVGRDGRADVLLDAEGQMMPRPPAAPFNVPLVHGLRSDYHPVRPVEDADVRALLLALGGLSPEASALVSDVELKGGETWVRTTPLGERGSVAVRLGQGDYTRKFADLHAFWHRAMLPKADTDFELVDLRFDSQIVTREAVDRP